MAKKRGRQGEGSGEGEGESPENAGEGLMEGAAAAAGAVRDTAESVLARAADQGRAIMGQAQEQGRALYGKVRVLVKDHPAALLAVAAGVGIVFEAEIAAGALVGIALTELLEHGRSDGLLARGRGLLARGLHNVGNLVGPKTREAGSRP
jgi:ElaB/YqjD/DUF883 family membrane-anchored ribosome-binding protein